MLLHTHARDAAIKIFSARYIAGAIQCAQGNACNINFLDCVAFVRRVDAYNVLVLILGAAGEHGDNIGSYARAAVDRAVWRRRRYARCGAVL